MSGIKIESDPTPTKKLLTNRETQILGLIDREYLSNQQLADRLELKYCTVAFHLENIAKKLQTRGRYNAVVKAKKLGIL